MVEDTGSDSDSAPSSSRSTFRSDILRSIVAHQCLKIGWHSVTDSSLTALTNVLDSYLKRFSQNIAGYAGVAGRTVPTVKDFQVALRDVEPSVQLKDLSSFCANLKDSALEFEINLPVVAGKEPVESASREGPASPGIVNGSEPSGSSQAPIPLVNGVHDERPEWMDDDLVFPPVNNGGHVRPVEKERPKENEVKTRPVLSDIIIAEDDEDIFPQSSFAAQKALPCRPEASATAGPRLLKSVSLVNGQFLFPEATVLPSARPPLPPPPVVKPPKPVEMPPKQKRKTSISETADASTPVGLPPHKKQKIKFIMTEPLPVTSDSVHPPGDELKIRIPHPKPEKEKKLKKDRKAPSAERMPVELPIPPAPRNDFAPVRLPSPPPLDSHERPHKSVMLKFKKPVPLLVNKKDQNSDERGPEFVEIRNHEHARRPEKHKKPRRELELYPVASQQQSSVMEKPKKKLDQAIDRIKQQQRDGVLPEELHRNHNHHLPQYDRIPKPYHNDVGMYPAVEQPRKTKKEHKHEEDRERKRAEREKERMRMIQEENIRRLEAEEFAKRQEAEEFANNEELRMQRAREARQREEQARRIRAEELLKREQQFHQEVIVPPVEPKKVKHRDGKKPSETHRFLQQEYMMQPTPPKAIQKGSDRPLSRDQDGPQSRPGSSSSRPGSAPEKPHKQQLPPNNQPPLKVTFKMPAKETVAKASLPPPPPERAPPLSITSPQPYQTAEPRFDLMAGVPHASPSNQKLSFTPPVYPPAPATTAPLDLSMKSPARPPVAPVAPVPSVVSPASRPLSGHKLARPTAPSETKPSKLPRPKSAQIPVDVVPLDEAPVMSKKKTPETAPVYVPPVLPPSAPPTPIPRPSTPQSDPLQPGLMGEGDKLWICPSCGRPDDGSPMVGCDECDDWFHWPCVGLMTEPTVEKWFCPRCTDRKLSKSKKGKKR